MTLNEQPQCIGNVIITWMNTTCQKNYVVSELQMGTMIWFCLKYEVGLQMVMFTCNKKSYFWDCETSPWSGKRFRFPARDTCGFLEQETGSTILFWSQKVGWIMKKSRQNRAQNIASDPLLYGLHLFSMDRLFFGVVVFCCFVVFWWFVCNSNSHNSI